MESRSLRDLTGQEIDAYWRDGAVCLRGVFPPVWIERMAAAIDEVLERPSQYGVVHSADDDPGTFFTDYLMWRERPAFRAYVFDSPGGEIAAQLLRSETIRFFIDGIFSKEPGTEKPTPWHHDQGQYPLDGRQLVSLWMPVDPVPQESALRFVRGSHESGHWFSSYRWVDDDAMAITGEDYVEIPDIDADPDTYEVVSWALEPGDCVAFHDMGLHSSAGTAEDGPRRRALSTRWLGDDVHYGARKGDFFPFIRYIFDNLGGRLDDDSVFPRVWPR